MAAAENVTEAKVMAITIQSILDDILREEGGFTDNPADHAHYGKADPAKGHGCVRG